MLLVYVSLRGLLLWSFGVVFVIAVLLAFAHDAWGWWI